MVIEYIGFIGTLLSVSAYFPQMRHIVKEHCSGGVSVRSWSVWLIASILLFSYAVTTEDLVFKTLQTFHVLAMITMIGLTLHYKPQVCHSKESLMKKKKVK